ncbi:MAG: alpha-2-macroglobulin family protein, partial [Flavobacteriales bacterium]
TFLPELDAWTVGTYRIDVSVNDPQGIPVKANKVITIYDPTIQNTGFVNDAFHVELLKTTVEPGESAAILISSALDECRVLMEVERDGKIVVNRRILLKKGQQLLEIPALELDRGGFAVHFVCVERGLQHMSTQWIDVPWSNKELNVEWQTFRDKLLPGQDEEWRLKITGPKKEKVAAQLLAVMYDASLDHFVPHNWNLSIWRSNSALLGWSRAEPFGQAYGQEVYRNYAGAADTSRRYPYLETFGMGRYRGVMDYSAQGQRGVVMHRNSRMDADAPAPGLFAEDEMSIAASPVIDDAEAGGLDEERLDKSPEPPSTPSASTQQPLRSDFRETAFFFPVLLTDRDGSIVLRFKTPDALTRWKVLGLAHTPDLKIANFSKETITQKPLMVVPNLPRFLRVGDRITLTAKVNVIEGGEVLGNATIELFDPQTNRTVTNEFGITEAVRNFNAGPGKSASVEWDITVPETWSVVGIRISASNGRIGDGEERVLPVLTDKVFVTESLPIAITKAGTKTFTLDKLKNTTSTTLKHQNLKLEFTPNPAWYAVQALPYMMEFPHACAEQTFSRYYANRLAGHIVEERPVIESVFKAWKEQAETNGNEGAFLSALEKDHELKTAVLEETPWVLNANNETERKHRIALFFDLQRMGSEEAIALKKLQDMQLDNGGWPWWSGMRESRYITQHIVAGFGHLEKLGASDLRTDGPAQRMLQKAVQWLDADIDRGYKELVQRNKAEALENYEPSILDIHMLYARSFFERWPITGGTNTAMEFYKKRLAATWLQNGFQGQAMAALALDRMGDHATAELIMISLSQRATRNEELGMYWKEFKGGYSWSEFPTETHALMIEAFHEVMKDDQSVDALRQYLLKLKQTTDWKTTKATSEACYALLLTGSDLLEPKSQPVIKVGTEQIRADAQEAGTGYFTQSWSGDKVKPEMGAVTITTSEDGVQWGALHWQYLEQMDKVTPHESPFVISKKVMLHEQTESGPQLIALNKARNLKAGDLLTMRIELKTDRYVDYVHLKDLRAAGLEPTVAISGYNYQGGLGYYQSIRDVAMHFFFDRISPGTYVFEYDLRVTHAGDFSSGITTAMCMYAPEFSSHSEGIRVAVEE